MLNEKTITELIDRYGKQITLSDCMKYAHELREALMYWRAEKRADSDLLEAEKKLPWK